MTEKEQKTGNLSKVLNAFGAFTITAFTSIGLLYVLRGNLILTGVFGLLVLGAVMLFSNYLIGNKKKEKELFAGNIQDKRTNSKTPEYILLGLYFLVAIITFPFIFHFIDVDFNRKDSLKNAGIEKAEMITDLNTEYKKAIKKKIDNYETSVRSNLDNYMLDNRSLFRDSLKQLFGGNDDILKKYERNSGDNKTERELKSQVRKAIKNEADRIESKYSIGNLEKKSQFYVKDAKNIFTKWKLLQVSYSYYDIDNMYEKVLTEMKNKMSGFTHEKKQTTDIALDSASSSMSNASILIILICLIGVFVLHLLVLAEYFSTSRKKSILVKRKQGGQNKNSKF